MTILSFSKTVHRCILHSTQSSCCSEKPSTSFLLRYGPVTDQILTLWGFRAWCVEAPLRASKGSFTLRAHWRAATQCERAFKGDIYIYIYTTLFAI